jgi:selenium metabolism protein YedF
MAFIEVDARGMACPIPVVKTRQAIANLNGAGEVETLVDNEIAVQNLKKMADQKGYDVESQAENDGSFRVKMKILRAESESHEKIIDSGENHGKIVVAVGADHMGEGDNELGHILIKGFLFALTTQERLPDVVLFFNGGAKLTCEGSESLEDLKKLEKQGVEILTCGTCLDFYHLTDKLAVGGVTNMYDIVERQMNAARIIKP